MATTVNKQLLESVRIAMDAALVSIAQANGLKSLTCGKCVYDPNAGNFTFKVEGIAEGALDPSPALYQSAGFLGLPALGAEFKDYNGSTFKTAGLNKTATKVLCERSDGKRYLFPVAAVRALCLKVPA